MASVLLTERTKAVLAERQAETRRNAERDIPPSVRTGGEVRRFAVSGRGVPTITRDLNFVGNPNMVGMQAGWTIVKGDTPSLMQQNGITARRIGYEKHPVVHACIRIVTDIIAAVPFEVYRKPKEGESKTRNRSSSDDVVLVPESPAQTMLNAPWYSMSPHRLRELMGVWFQVYGNWFMALIREGADPKGPRDGSDDDPNGLPAFMRPVHPERLLYVYLDAITEEPILYDWRDRYGYRHRTPAVSMLHCADSTCTDFIFGYPRAAAGLLDMSTDNEASAYVRQVVHNDGTAGTVFLMEEAITEEEARRLKERYYQRNVQRGERGRTDFVGNVKDVKVVGFTLKDLEFPNLRQVAREDICAVFGVDPRMVGVSSATGSKEGGLSGKQFLEARFRLIQQTVLPLMRAFESYLDTWLMPEFGSDLYCRFSREYLNALTEDETETWTRTTAAYVAGGISREEFRSYIGQPDAMDPADLVWQPSLGLLVPVSEQTAAHERAQQAAADRTALAGQQVAQLQDGDDTKQLPGGGKGERPTEGEGTTGKQNPNSGKGANAANAGAGGAGKADTSGKPSNGKRPPASKRLANVITSEPGSPSGGEVLQPLQQRTRALLRFCATPVVGRAGVLTGDVRRAAFDIHEAKAAAHEPRMQHAASNQLSRDRDACTRAVRSAAASRQASIPDPEYKDALRAIDDLLHRNTGKLVTEWRSLFSPLIADAVHDGAKSIAHAVGVNWDLKNPRVLKAIDRRAAKLADRVGEYTQQLVTESLRVAYHAGMGIREAADLIEKSAFSDDMSATRAMRIARTESIGALNEGEYSSAKASGVIGSKEWLTQQDDRVRDSHAEIDGETVGLDDVFSNGLECPGDENGDPEDVINCRCSLLYHTDEAADDNEEPDDTDTGADDTEVDPNEPFEGEEDT